MQSLCDVEMMREPGAIQKCDRTFRIPQSLAQSGIEVCGRGELLVESAQRWGREAPPISRALLEAVLHFGAKDAELWIARFEGEAIAGGIVLYGSQELFFWTAALRTDFGALRPSNALNVAVGLLLPGVIAGLGAPSGVSTYTAVGYLVITAATLFVAYQAVGLRRRHGVGIILAYLAFVAILLAIA